MSECYVGEIRLLSFPRVPNGWFACDGSLRPISQYDVLYQLLGTTYGGDGVNTFGLPDLRGRIPLHQGTGIGLSPRVIGQLDGTESVTLNSNQLPLHTHIANATNNNASTKTPGPTVLPGALTTTDTMYATDLAGSSSFTMANTSISAQGGSQPHDNTMPTLTVSYCIAYQGFYPSQG
ncbi:phage tail protein [Dyella monticola]|uniref:Phage tail protein n=1 Tax=Dyella monticola TaxID=1927958 RepID=A0A370X006_9GAMM|nr:tail fiber protein [Dyella monticola]RDS81682.1 phage tail protein [Dyella monticola]